jgi:hypothetical protein
MIIVIAFNWQWHNTYTGTGNEDLAVFTVRTFINAKMYSHPKQPLKKRMGSSQWVIEILIFLIREVNTKTMSVLGIYTLVDIFPTESPLYNTLIITNLTKIHLIETHTVR